MIEINDVSYKKSWLPYSVPQTGESMVPLIENILDSLRVTMTAVESLAGWVMVHEEIMHRQSPEKLDQAVLSETLQEVKDMKDRLSELAEAVEALEEEAQ